MRVVALYLHPVKSCAPLPVSEARIEPQGFADDRRWMLVDDEDRFVSLRTEPRLATIRTRFDGDRIVLERREADEPVAIPRAGARGRTREVTVWHDRVPAVEHEGGSAWVSAQLGRRLRLVYMPPDVVRSAGSAAPPQHRVAFADAYPLLLLSRASVAEVSRRAGVTLDERRFRPNVVVDADAAHAEDALDRFAIGDLAFRNVKPCDRCVATTVDPDTGETGREPLRTLATYRRRDGKVWFGVSVIAEGPGTVRVGDRVTAV